MPDDRKNYRLVCQLSIPFFDPPDAEQWYIMLKEIIQTQDSKSTLFGQVIKALEPCCSEKRPGQFPQGVVSYGPPLVR